MDKLFFDYLSERRLYTKFPSGFSEFDNSLGGPGRGGGREMHESVSRCIVQLIFVQLQFSRSED